jgi:hypothetical protein
MKTRHFYMKIWHFYMKIWHFYMKKWHFYMNVILYEKKSPNTPEGPESVLGVDFWLFFHSKFIVNSIFY